MLAGSGSSSVKTGRLPAVIEDLTARNEVQTFTSCGGCSWTGWCSSGIAATPTDNNNTAASWHKTYIALLLARPCPLPTVRGIVAAEAQTKLSLCVCFSSADYLISHATRLANFILATCTICRTPPWYTSRWERPSQLKTEVRILRRSVEDGIREMIGASDEWR